MSVMYRPDPFFEAQSSGPAVTFGFISPMIAYASQVAAQEAAKKAEAEKKASLDSGFAVDIDMPLADVYGPGWDKRGIPLNPDRKAYLSQWPDDATDEEAEVLFLKDQMLWSNSTRKKMGLPPLPKNPPIPPPKVVTVTKYKNRIPTWAVVAAGVGALVLVGGAFFAGRGRRRGATL